MQPFTVILLTYMLQKSLIEKIINIGLDAGADFVEIFDEDSFLEEIRVSGDGVENYLPSREFGTGIRMISNGNTVYGYASDKTEKSLVSLALSLGGSIHAALPERKAGIELSGPVSYTTDCLIRPSSISSGKRLAPAFEAVKAGLEYSDSIIWMTASITDMEQHVLIANSEGLHAEDERIKTRMYLSAAASIDGVCMTGYYGPGAMRGREFYEMTDVGEAARETARRAVVMAGAEPCRGGVMPVVIANGFGGLVFHEACGHSLEGIAVVKGASEFAGRLGERIASDKVTLIDDGSLDGEWGSLHIDDEGTRTRRNVLIRDGVLESFLLDRMSAGALGLKSTGSARRQNYRFHPTSRMNNTFIASGEDDPAEILADTGYGLYVAGINGGSVDPATGKFNFNAGECYMIRNGEIAEAVRNVTLIGRGSDVLTKVDRVGNDYSLGQGYCFDTSGTLFIGAGQPTIRISEMTVGGAGE